jgi:ATP-dependent Lhr-like helicase
MLSRKISPVTLRRKKVVLPEPFARWFAARGWRPHAHQLDLLAAARENRAVLLIAPTGGGKTLSGFLPSLVELAAMPADGLHTLYISPLKALAVDVHRNVERPIVEMGLGITTESRTGDTPVSKKQRQRRSPPNILMTTPESLALLLAHKDAGKMFKGLRRVVIDEVHALAGTKRGDLLALGLARLRRLAPASHCIGLSATVAFPDALGKYIHPDARIIVVPGGPKPQISVVGAHGRMPWSGHMGLYAIPDVYRAIAAHKSTLIFVNTRATAELVFQALWKLNDQNLAIALHHGSLDRAQRRKVEAAMAGGDLRAVVATSSLDLGVDWGAVDLVVQMGAPKGTSRLIQRIGRSNHRFDEPSRALLVPGNRFEALECAVARTAVLAGALDGDPPRPGALDVLCQHIMGMACAAPFRPDDLYAEVISAAPYADLARADFDAALRFVENGGYSLRAYERYARLLCDSSGFYHIRNPRFVRQYRMNVGVIVEAETILVRMGKRKLGRVEEQFIASLTPGDTFIFGGRLLKYEGIRDGVAVTSRGAGKEPKVPAYMGGRLPLSAALGEAVQSFFHQPERWSALEPEVQEWLNAQKARAGLPAPGRLMVETFPRAGRHFTVVYGFAGRNAHQSLGLLMTRRMLRLGCKPAGFVAGEYAVAVWSLKKPDDIPALLDPNILGYELEDWINESNMLRRTFRTVAVIAGLIDRKHPGHQKTGRQVNFNSDIIYDVLRQHEPHHILLRATRADAASGLIDLDRLTDMLVIARDNIDHYDLDRISPLAVPVILTIGKESVGRAMIDDLLDDAGQGLIEEAMG